MKQNKKLYLLILLVLACLILLATGTYAAYTDTAYARRVVTTGIETDLLPFSSNYLYEHSNGYTRHTIVASQNADTKLYLTVCNYPQKDNTKFSTSDIAYLLDITVVDKDGKPTGVEAPTVSPLPGAYTLKGGQTSTDIFAITFPKERSGEFMNRFVRVTATSTSGLSPERELAAEFELVAASALSGEWTGRFTDDKNPPELDAFNYEVSGTGKGTLTVSWDNTYVTLSRWCRDLAPYSAVNSEDNSISFSVGGENQPTSYLLQFYRLKPRTTDDEWPNIVTSWTKAPDPTEATTEPTP